MGNYTPGTFAALVGHARGLIFDLWGYRVAWVLGGLYARAFEVGKFAPASLGISFALSLL